MKTKRKTVPLWLSADELDALQSLAAACGLVALTGPAAGISGSASALSGLLAYAATLDKTQTAAMLRGLSGFEDFVKARNARKVAP